MELKLDNLVLPCDLQPLLIVPYGIETCDYEIILFFVSTFNRTLWN